MKPAVYYAVIRRGWTSQLGFLVAAVTSEQGGKMYFRSVQNGESSNCAKRDVRARYISQNDAEAAIQRVLKANAHNNGEVEAARKILRSAEQKREAALDAALHYGSVTETEIAKLAAA